MKFSILLFFLCIGCSTKWMDGFIREDFDKITVHYPRIGDPFGFLPSYAPQNCLQVSGMKPEALVSKLNKRVSITSFKTCQKNPLKISLTENGNSQETGINRDAMKLKMMGSKMKGGNTILGMILLSAISTESEMVKAKITADFEVNGAKSTKEFETNFYDLRDVKTTTNTEGKFDLQEILIDEIVTHVSANIKKNQTHIERKLSFKTEAECLEHFKWQLHHEDYRRAMELLDFALEQDPNCKHAHFNKGLLFELSGNYQSALAEYQKEGPSSQEDVSRIKDELSYIENWKKIYPNLK